MDDDEMMMMMMGGDWSAHDTYDIRWMMIGLEPTKETMMGDGGMADQSPSIDNEPWMLWRCLCSLCMVGAILRQESLHETYVESQADKSFSRLLSSWSHYTLLKFDECRER